MKNISITGQNQNKLILIGLLGAILIGVGIGYMLFHSSPQNTTPTLEASHIHPAGSGATESIWTCSMHPQIRQPEPGDCPICGMDLIPANENTSSNPAVLEMTPSAAKLAQIETTVIGASSVTGKKLSLSGKIQVDERLAASQVVHIPGRIEKLYVTFTGEAIQRGQKLATLYSPELVTAQRELLEALKLKATNPNLVEAAKKKLEFWKISPGQISEIEKSGKIQETFVIVADASGIVTKRRVAVGDYMKQGDVMFEIMNLNRVWVLFDAYEEDLAYIKIGDKIHFTTPAIPNQEFETKITFIDPVINPATRVASLRGEVSNGKMLLKPEMFVRGMLHSRVEASTELRVPASAVLWTGKRSVIYVKVPEMAIPSYRYQEVTLGEREGDSYIVEKGLTDGDEVVTQGSFTIDAAAQLNNQQSMMNRQVTIKGTSSPEVPDYLDATPSAFKVQLQSLVEAYLPLKDALVGTDAVTAAQTVNTFLQKLSEVDMSLLKGDVHVYWMEQHQALSAHGSSISSASEVVDQREQFRFLTIALIQSIQALGISSDTLYIQHCPMANENKGADWISTESAILNPYFGDEMLTCGKVTDTLFGIPKQK